MTRQKSTQSKISRKHLSDVSFSVAARVAMQLGRESISNSIVAITELVKNAYDADAERVRILFSGLESKSPFLVIEDDGHGMTEKQFRQHWMVIGTSNKQETRKSLRKGRILTGEKGLGRLGLDRLCKKTVARFFSKSKSDGIELEIDWHKYERTNQRLENITHECYKIEKTIVDPITGVSRHIVNGTQLILSGLKDNWTQEYLLDLRKELTLLVSPFKTIKDFTVELSSGMNWENVDGEVRSTEMLVAAEWKLLAKIDNKNRITYIMSLPKHEEVFKFGPTPWRKKFRDMSEYPRCGPLKFEMYFFPRRTPALKDLRMAIPQINAFLNANQGIRIYRDGFRVNPYGEPNGEGDWLRLSFRRQQSPAGVTQGAKPGGWRVGYNQVVGAVFLKRDKNPNLIDQTNREGIVEGPGFYDLKAFAEDAVRFFETSREKFERARVKATDYEKVEQSTEQTLAALAQAVRKLREAIHRTEDLLRIAKKQHAQLDVTGITNLLNRGLRRVVAAASAVKDTQTEFARASRQKEIEFERQKDTLANLASLGILTATFGHETLASSNLVATNAKQLEGSIRKGQFMVLPDVLEAVNDNLKFIIHGAQKIETFAKFALRNVNRDKRKRTSVPLNKVAKEVFAFFAKSLKERNIDVDLTKVPAKVSPILGFRIDWESIFVNFITNSVWALRDTQATKRNIRVVIEEIENRIEIKFADSGHALEEGTEDKIFLPTFSTKRNEKGEIIGTGMGLTIVKGFVEDYNGGAISVESPCDLGGAQFRIRIPVPSLSRRGKKAR